MKVAPTAHGLVIEKPLFEKRRASPVFFRKKLLTFLDLRQSCSAPVLFCARGRCMAA
jgi:hypothetical protein